MTSEQPYREDKFFLDHLLSWIIIDVDSAFPRVPQIKPYGTHAAGFVFLDHVAGITVRVDSFLVFSSDGYPRLTRNVLGQDERLFYLRHGTGAAILDDGHLVVARNAPLTALTCRKMTDAEMTALHLSSIPSIVENYYKPHYADFRNLSWLDPYRIPWFFDDIQVWLPSDTAHGEMVRVRIEQMLSEDSFAGTLLTQPNVEAGYNEGESVLVRDTCDNIENRLTIAGHFTSPREA